MLVGDMGQRTAYLPRPEAIEDGARAATPRLLPAPIQTLLASYAARQSLSRREFQVVEMALLEMHTKEIADQFDCAPSTVEEYWKRIYRKTGAASKVAVISRLLMHVLS